MNGSDVRLPFCVLVSLGAIALASCGETPVGTVGPEVELAKGGKGGSKEFSITGFRVDRVDGTHGLTDDPDIDGELASRTGMPSNYFGCPEVGHPCNRLVMDFEGQIDSIAFRVGHNVRGLYFNDVIEGAHHAMAWLHGFMPMIPVDVESGQVTVYWQGQRRHDLCCPPSDEWDTMPNLDPLEDADSFVFTYAYKWIQGKHTEVRFGGAAALRSFSGGSAVYQGGATTLRAYPVLYDFREMQRKMRGKGGGEQIWVRFKVKSFARDPGATEDTNISADHHVLVTRPDGSQYFAQLYSSGIDPNDPIEPDIVRDEFNTEYLSLDGCHQVDLIGVYGHASAYGSSYDGRNVVWDPEAGADPGLAVYFDASTGEVTFDLEGCSATVPSQ